jgi:AcrR family transcriptional regulator
VAHEDRGSAGSAVTRGPARRRRLRPGPGQPAEEVAADQRDRIHEAMVELVAEQGYEAVKVTELVGRAHVSTRTFYERYGGKQECLLEIYDELIRRVATRMAESLDGETDRRERSRLALGTLAEVLAERPEAARLVCIDASAAGLAVLDRMRGAEAAFEEVIRRTREHDPPDKPISPTLAKGLMAGLTQVVRARLIARRHEELPGLVDEMVDWAYSLNTPGVHGLEELGREAGDPRAAASALALTTPMLAQETPGSRERHLILAATVELAAEDGYWQLTVPRIRTAAGVSRKSFEAHFADVEECFVAAVGVVAESVMGFVREQSLARGKDWPQGFHHAVSSLCVYAASNPDLARLALIEIFVSGPFGMRHLSNLIGTMAERLRSDAPPGQAASESVAEAAMGAVWGIVSNCVAEGRASQLPELAPLLSFLALGPTIGSEPAAAAIRAEHTRSTTVRP